MKLARDQWLLFIIPAGFLLAGGWWVIASGFGADRGNGGTRFEFADSAREPQAASPGLPVAPPATIAPKAPATAKRDALGVVDPAKTAEPSPWGIWTGHVVDRNGVPIEGATVNITARRNLTLGDNTTIGESETFTAKIGRDGTLVFEMKPGFRYKVEVRADGYGLEVFEIGGQAGQDLVLDRAGSVDGRVFAQGSKNPLGGVTITFQNGNEHYTTITDENGRFSFDGVAARPAHVTVTDNRFIARTQSVDGIVPGGRSPLLDLFLDPGSALNGEVVTDGSLLPVGGLPVSLVDRLTQETVATGLTDPAGRFSFFSLIPMREYYVSVLGPWYRTDRPAQVVGRGDSVTLTVTPTWVLDFEITKSGDPASGVTAWLRRQDGLPIAPGQLTLPSVSNGDGFVSFGGLSRDLAYRVVIAAPGSATMEFGPIGTTDGNEQLIPVDMVPGHSVMGHVYDTDGQPVASVTVRATRLDGLPAPPLFVQTDADGAFFFDTLLPGLVQLVTFRSGYDNSRSIVVITDDAPTAAVALTIPHLLPAGPSNGTLSGQ